MNTVTQEEAIARLPKLIDQGEEVIVSRGGTAVAKIIPLPKLGQDMINRKAGSAKGQYFYMAEDFDSPSDEAVNEL